MTVRVLVGDALSVLRTLPAESVQCVVTSPPYLGLRSYGTEPQIWGGDESHDHQWDSVPSPGSRTSDTKPGPLQHAGNKGRERLTSDLCACGAWRGELGLEPTPALFMEHLVSIFDEVWRVLRKDGLVFCNIGDSYSGSPPGNKVAAQNSTLNRSQTSESYRARLDEKQRQQRQGFTGGRGIPAKNLLLVPQRFAIAMQERGWIVRSEIAWCLSGGTQVYVRSQKGDMSMSVKDMARLKPETLQLWNGERWTRVVRMWESTDDGDPLEIELRSGERIGCTPGHLWPVDIWPNGERILPARDLQVGDRLKRVRLPEPTLPRKPSALDDADIGWLIGLYLAEGCPSTNSLSIASHIKETVRFERVQRIAETFDGSATMRQGRGNAATISVYGRILRTIVEEYISGKGAHGKHLTNACWRRSDVFLRSLLDGYLHGDGHWDDKNQRWRLGFARNYEFAADLRTICARLGVSLRLRARFATLGGKRFPTFRGEIRFTRNGSVYEKSDDEIVAIGCSKGRKFWDIEVEDEPHTFALASGILTHNCKTSAMPESVRDRPTSAWEPIWMFAKSQRYYFDQDAVRIPLSTRMPGSTIQETHHYGASNGGNTGLSDYLAKFKAGEVAGANLRNVWTLGPSPFADAHFATFPPEIPRRCILAGTSERGACPNCGSPWVRETERTPMVIKRSDWGERAGNRTASSGTMVQAPSSRAVGWEPSCSCPPADPVPQLVCDPFGGSGTTGLVADRLGRDAVLVELNPEYAEMARKRIEQDAGTLFGDPVAVEQPQQIDLFGEVS